MNRVVITSIVAVLLIAGCNKKAKETVADTPPPPPTKTPAPSPSPSPSGSGNTGTVTPGGTGSGTTPSLSVGGGGGGGGVMSTYKAARRTEALSELNQLALLIEQLRDPIGKMPTREQIIADLKKSAPKILRGIEEGAYILTGTMDGGGLWAYELDADKKDGIAVIGGRAFRSTTDDVRRYLGKN